jgi:hypothetical protein
MNWDYGPRQRCQEYFPALISRGKLAFAVQFSIAQRQERCQRLELTVPLKIARHESHSMALPLRDRAPMHVVAG